MKFKQGGFVTNPSQPRKRTKRHRLAAVETTGKKLLASGEITLPPGLIPSPSGGKSSALDFTHALMQGNPAAVNALEFAMRDEEASLADEFIASSYTMSKQLKLKAGAAKKFDAMMMQYRDDMRRAHRFVLDNDFTRYATDLSNRCTPEKLLARLQLATLPYEVTWIEFDLWTKLRVMREFHGLDPNNCDYHNTSRKMGMLVHRINETDALCEIVNRWGMNDIVGPNLLGYLFSTREREWGAEKYFGCMPLSVIGLKAAEQGEASKAAKALGISAEEQLQLHAIGQQVTGGSMWGFTTGGSSTFVTKFAQLKSLRTPEFLRRHGDAAFGRMYYALDEALTQSGYKTEPIDHTAQIELAEFTGSMRWLVIVLAMLNEVPVQAQLVQPSHQLKAGLTKRIRAMDYHRLTLRLPKTKPVPYLERKLANIERHNRAHEVRQHWRTYLHDEHCRIEEHEWEYDHNEGYALCGKCMAYRRRIPEHVRGDPNLGWVRKDYIVKPTKQE